MEPILTSVTTNVKSANKNKHYISEANFSYGSLKMLAVKYDYSLTVSCRTVADTGSKVPAFQQLADNRDIRIPPSSCSSPQSRQRSRHGTNYYSAHSPRKICYRLGMLERRILKKNVIKI